METSLFTPTPTHLAVLSAFTPETKRSLRIIYLKSPTPAAAISTILKTGTSPQLAILSYEIAEHMLNPWNLDENHLN